jgi:DNA-binding MarR family transcriptional regulator
MPDHRSDHRSDMPEAGERILAGLSKLGLVMRHEAWRAAGLRGLTPTQAQILAVLAASREPAGVKSVARTMAITMPTASEAVAALQAKGLVRKARSTSDGRAVTLTLTARGRREAGRGAPWPGAMAEAVSKLPLRERAGLIRGLVTMIRQLQQAGAVPTSRMCVECVHFRPEAHPGTRRPHHCRYLDSPIGDSDLRLDCPEMEPAETRQRERLWGLFLHGRPLTTRTPGTRRSPSKSRRHATPVIRSTP